MTRRINLAENWKNLIAEFPVTRMEFRVLEQIEDGSTIDDVLRVSPLSELESLRLLFLLSSVNLMQLVDGAKVIDINKYSKKDAIISSEKDFDPKEEPTGEEEISNVEQSGDKERIVEISPAENGFPDYQTNVVEVRGDKVKKSSIFWKIFITAAFISALWIAGIYLYVNDFYGLDKYFYEKTANSREIREVFKATPKEIVTPEPTLVKTEVPTKTEPKVATVPAVTPKTIKTLSIKQRELIDFNGHFKKGREYYDQGRLLNALDEFRQCYEIDPKHGDLLVEMGLVYFELRRSIDAIEKYKEALKLNPLNAKAHLYLGNAYQYHKKISLAVEEYNKYLALDPDSVHAVEVRKILKKITDK
jgi:tetratricopeptide (TPR) repeat protein